ncbi:MAG: hypothetical protein ACR2QC_06195 [Gammaproteobacteria bacterium]
MNIKIPGFLHLRKKYGLLITDGEVSVISWHKGDLERIGLFSNDDTGVARLLDFFAKNTALKDQPFHVLVNIIGEDYRFEKVAHLIGKYRTDFHARRMQQLFRGSQFCMSQVQGREERGRREDWVLFSGVLTENKVLPWINVLTRGGRYLAGVHMVSHLLSESVLRTIGGDSKGNNLVLTIHERGLLRQTFYVNGHLRFSRVSKITDDSAEQVGASIKRELERTLQYLNSLKISIGGGMTVRMISPSTMVGQLRESVASGDRIKFEFHDVAQVAGKIGLHTPVETMGRDSSLPLHVMFSSLCLRQIARLQLVSYYFLQMFAKTSIAVLFLYGITAYWTPLSDLKEGYDFQSEAGELEDRANTLKRRYNSEVSGIVGEPPSSAENMQAVSELYSVLENINVSPTQLLFFIGQGLRKNSHVEVTAIDWELSNTPLPSGDPDNVVVSGGDIYQIARLEGNLLAARTGETYRDVARRARNLVESFRTREDVHVEVLEIPSESISTENLSGELSGELDVEAPTTRKFALQIIWKQYDQSGLSAFVDTL